MVVVDSCGWLEWFSDGQLDDQYQQYLENRHELLAADSSLRHNLAMADAIVYAAALTNTCRLITSDRDLEALPEVAFISRS